MLFEDQCEVTVVGEAHVLSDLLVRLHSIPSAPLELTFEILNWLIRLHLALGDLSAVQHYLKMFSRDAGQASTALTFTQEMLQIRLLLAEGETQVARSLLERSLALASAKQQMRNVLEILLLMTLAYAANKQEQQVHRTLQQALSQAQGEGFIRCRQLFHQAKEHLTKNRTRFSPSQEALQRLMELFLSASQQGDMQALVGVLAQDMTWWPDGGGKVHAAPYALPGREQVLRVWKGLLRQAASYPNVHLALAPVNGSIGLLIWSEKTLLGVFTCEITEGQISALYAVVNPDKLVYIQKQVQSHDLFSHEAS